ncbi:MAG: gamma-butyrobetaine hydroxylase-like domain-containing protein [Candidatus Acidiferrales bacterium]
MASNPRTEPAGVRILLTSGEGVRIEWRDGHRSLYTFPYLRQSCPCATCRDRRAHGASPTQSKVKSDLPLYEAPARAVQAEPVGNYAVRFTFSDGHATGIYSFEYFREICPCEECTANRKESKE